MDDVWELLHSTPLEHVLHLQHVVSAGNVFGAKCANRPSAVHCLHCLKELWEIVQRMARLVPILLVQSETADENGLVNGSSAVRPDN
jgi:hypothetical protein